MQMAMQAVWTHRFRSLLTILGIVIGITTVVTVASLLTGLRQGVVTFFQELGPDNIFLFRSSGDPSAPDQQLPPKERKRRALKPEYAEYIKRSCHVGGGCGAGALHSARGGRQSHDGAACRATNPTPST